MGSRDLGSPRAGGKGVRLVSARALAACLGVLLATSPVQAQLDQLLKGLGVGQTGALSEAKAGAGLKEALEVATENSVSITGGPTGISRTRRSRS